MLGQHRFTVAISGGSIQRADPQLFGGAENFRHLLGADLAAIGDPVIEAKLGGAEDQRRHQRSLL